MFCPKCGANNEDGVRFCASCGAEVVDNQPQMKAVTLPVSVTDVVRVFGSRITIGISALPKAAKRLLIAAIALLFVIFILIVIGSILTNPKNIAKGYFESMASGDWERMFGYLPYDNSEFINKNSFSKYMDNEKKLEVINFNITEELTGQLSGKSSELGFMETGVSIADAAEPYMQLTSMLKDGETEYKSITVTKFTDKSDGAMTGPLKYSCVTEIEYDYVVETNDGEETQESSNTSICFTYTYEGGAWGLTGLDSLGAFSAGAEGESTVNDSTGDITKVLSYTELCLKTRTFTSFWWARDSTFDIAKISALTAKRAGYQNPALFLLVIIYKLSKWV